MSTTQFNPNQTRKLVGGPYSGLNMHYNGPKNSTFQFQVRGLAGRYDEAVWVPAPSMDRARALGFRVQVESSVRAGTDRTTSGSIGQP